jgi:hypothetical protein
MKICSTCKLEPALPPCNNGRPRYRCKTCMNDQHKDYYEKNRKKRAESIRRKNQKSRDFMDSLKDKPCVDCGKSFPPCVMDFDHRDKQQKKKNVGQMLGCSKDRILEEAAKCDIVCANCHRIRTYTKQQYGKETTTPLSSSIIV